MRKGRSLERWLFARDLRSRVIDTWAKVLAQNVPYNETGPKDNFSGHVTFRLHVDPKSPKIVDELRQSYGWRSGHNYPKFDSIPLLDIRKTMPREFRIERIRAYCSEWSPFDVRIVPRTGKIPIALQPMARKGKLPIVLQPMIYLKLTADKKQKLQEELDEQFSLKGDANCKPFQGVEVARGMDQRDTIRTMKDITRTYLNEATGMILDGLVMTPLLAEEDDSKPEMLFPFGGRTVFVRSSNEETWTPADDQLGLVSPHPDRHEHLKSFIEETHASVIDQCVALVQTTVHPSVEIDPEFSYPQDGNAELSANSPKFYTQLPKDYISSGGATEQVVHKVIAHTVKSWISDNRQDDIKISSDADELIRHAEENPLPKDIAPYQPQAYSGQEINSSKGKRRPRRRQIRRIVIRGAPPLLTAKDMEALQAKWTREATEQY